MALSKRTTGMANSWLMVALIITIYIILPLPFFVGLQKESTKILSFYQITLPILVGGLFFLVLTMPNRRISVGRGIADKIRAQRKQMIRLGTISGFISTISVLVLVTLGEYFTNLPTGTYLSVLGTVIGKTIFGSVHQPVVMGLVAHMFTGTFIGAIFGGVMSITEIFDFSRTRTIMLGTAGGFVAFLVLFNPVSRLGVEPYLKDALSMTMSGTNPIIIENAARQMMSNLLLGSLAMHLVYGFILGLVLYSMARKSKVI